MLGTAAQHLYKQEGTHRKNYFSTVGKGRYIWCCGVHSWCLNTELEEWFSYVPISIFQETTFHSYTVLKPLIPISIWSCTFTILCLDWNWFLKVIFISSYLAGALQIHGFEFLYSHWHGLWKISKLDIGRSSLYFRFLIQSSNYTTKDSLQNLRM